MIVGPQIHTYCGVYDFPCNWLLSGGATWFLGMGTGKSHGELELK